MKVNILSVNSLYSNGRNEYYIRYSCPAIDEKIRTMSWSGEYGAFWVPAPPEMVELEELWESLCLEVIENIDDCEVIAELGRELL